MAVDFDALVQQHAGKFKDFQAVMQDHKELWPDFLRWMSAKDIDARIAIAQRLGMPVKMIVKVISFPSSPARRDAIAQQYAEKLGITPREFVKIYRDRA